uniref:Uncharacterized protein n=1 Tax=Ciona intestinalis TaxID=7719 RepID=H2XYB8_CIOIN
MTVQILQFVKCFNLSYEGCHFVGALFAIKRGFATVTPGVTLFIVTPPFDIGRCIFFASNLGLDTAAAETGLTS